MSPRRAPQIAALTLFLMCGSANVMASASVLAHDATGFPGGLSSPSFMLDFGSFQEVTNISFSWEYDTSQLVFQKAQSTIDYGGQTRTLTAFIDFLKQSFGGSPQYFSTEGGNVGTSNRIYDYTLFADTPITLSGQVVFNLAFQLDGNAKAGQDMPVKVSGNIIDSEWNEYPYEALAIVRAVPEPGTWLLWLGGVGLLTVLSRHKQACI